MTTSAALRLSAFAVLALAAAPSLARQREMAPYGAKSCIPRGAVRDVSAENDSHLILHVGGGKAYRSYLREPCDGLGHINNISKLKFQSADPDKLCQGDTAVLLDHDGSFGIGGDPIETKCALGRFESVSEMSLSEFIRR